MRARADMREIDSGTQIVRRSADLFKAQQESVAVHTDRLFARLMVFQWLAGIGASVLISPRTWVGTETRIHVHVLAAVLLGGVITSLPVLLAVRHPGKVLTRHVIA